MQIRINIKKTIPSQGIVFFRVNIKNMKRNLLVIIVMMSALNMISQEKKAVIKTDLGFLSDYNFYQLSYEFNIEDKRSFEVGVGFGSESGINVYGFSIQGRYYISDLTPKGFHVGPRILAIYAESNNSNRLGVKDNTFGFEIDALIGHQFLAWDVLTIDPYAGPGLVLVENQTEFGFVFGITVGFAF